MKRRRCLGRLCLLALLALGSCRFFADEFTWLDRAGPVGDGPPDRPVSGLVERP